MSAAKAPASQQSPASQSSAPHSAPQNASQKGPSGPKNTEVEMMDRVPDSPPEHSYAAHAPSTAQSQHHQSGRPSGSSSTDTGKPVNHGAPGSSWTSKKFTEEYDTASSRVIHTEYEPGRYGDPLL